MKKYLLVLMSAAGLSIAAQAGAIFDSGPVFPASSATQGAVGDGVKDNTTVLQNALDKTGFIFLGPGTFMTRPLTIHSSSTIQGSGMGITFLDLIGGSNDDVIKGDVVGYPSPIPHISSYTATFGDGVVAGTNWWTLRDITIDGNKSNQSGTSNCVEVYGNGWKMINAHLRNCLNFCAYMDYTQPSGSGLGVEFQTITHDVFFSNCGDDGLMLAGPTDNQISDVESFNNVNSFHIGPNAAATLITNAHAWGMAQNKHATGFLIEGAGVSCTNCESEGADNTGDNVHIMGSETRWIGGQIFGIGGFSNLQTTGTYIGQSAGNAPIHNQVAQSAGLTTTVSSVNNVIDWPYMASNNPAIYNSGFQSNDTINMTINQSVGSAVGGFPDISDDYDFKVTGLTCNGFLATCGGRQISQGNAFMVSDKTKVRFKVNNKSTPPSVQISSSTDFNLYSDPNNTLNVFHVGGSLGDVSFGSMTVAGIAAFTPAAASIGNQYINCSNCTTTSLCVSTAATRGGVANAANKAAACQ